MYISDQDVVAVGNLIVETYDNIKEQRFSEGCNKTYCKWCNFVKNQLSPDSFRDEEVELLDDWGEIKTADVLGDIGSFLVCLIEQNMKKWKSNENKINFLIT